MKKATFKEFQDAKAEITGSNMDWEKQKVELAKEAISHIAKLGQDLTLEQIREIFLRASCKTHILAENLKWAGLSTKVHSDKG